MNPKTIIVMGISGSGKGTQGHLIKEFLQKETEDRVEYIETGKYFREFMQGDTYASKLSRDLMEEGALQPDFLAVWNWGGQLVEKITGDEHLIIDGAPRMLPEACMIHTALKFFKRPTPYVFYLKLSDDEARERLSARGRADDQGEALEERINWFKEHVLPAIEYFQNQDDIKYYELDGSLPIEEVQAQIKEIITQDE